jgi:hypothetical protein
MGRSRGGRQEPKEVKDPAAFTDARGKLSSFKWTENGVLHEVELVKDGALLRVGGKYYHMKDSPDHPTVIYKAPNGQQYLGIAVDARRGGAVKEDVDAVVFTGQGTVRMGSKKLQVEEDNLILEGVVYQPGDKITISGREALISLGTRL